MKAQKGKKVGPESKATGVVISRKDQKANPNDFKYLRKSEKAASEKALKPKVTKPKAKNGTSLGMKSVKAGFDKNPGVTRADIIVAAKKKAKSGTKMKKAMMGTMAKPMMKSGGKMSKCKYGCN